MKAKLFAAMVLFSIAISAFAQKQRNLLIGSVSADQLQTILISRDHWKPFPQGNDSMEWKSLPEPLRKAYIHNAEQYLNKPWEVLPATTFLDFARNGNRSRYEAISFARRKRLASLVLAEVTENRGRFMDEIANGVWAICEETFWGIPAHIGVQKQRGGLPDVTEPIIDLFAAETGSMLAWTMYLVGEKLGRISPLIPQRIYYEENRRIITPYLQRNNFAWMGFSSKSVNNWNPWINSNVLSVALLLEPDEHRRTEVTEKVMHSLDAFINGYPDDGGCDEGPSYWNRAGAALFDALELLHSATGGKINIYGNPLIRKMGQYIYKVWINDDYYINFADASAINQPEAGMVYRYGKRIQDSLMTGFGAYLAQREQFGETILIPEFGSLIRVLPDLFIIQEVRKEKPLEPYVSDFWLPDLQVAGARSDPHSSKGLYIAMKGGNNDESHNHNDVGNFIVYKDRKPVLIDAGVEVYTAKTFSRQRYEIWTMQSSYHNLPDINGIAQVPGPQFKAEDVKFSASPKAVRFSLDISKAYPIETGVLRWNRSLTLNRGKNVTVDENYSLKEWKAPVRLNFMTPFLVNTSEPGIIELHSVGPGDKTSVQMLYDKSRFVASSEDITIDDARLKKVWGTRISRIILTSRNKLINDRFEIILK